MKLKTGDIVRHGHLLHHTYIFAQVHENHYALIGLSSGNRYSDRNLGPSPSVSDLYNEYSWEYVGRLEDGN